MDTVLQQQTISGICSENKHLYANVEEKKNYIVGAMPDLTAIVLKLQFRF